jgi:hypothetical protein
MGWVRRGAALVSVQLFRALLPLALMTGGEQRSAIVADLKSVLRGYLAPLIGGVGRQKSDTVGGRVRDPGLDHARTLDCVVPDRRRG